MSKTKTADHADAVGQELMHTMRILHRAKQNMNALLPGRLDHSSFPIISRLVVDGPQRTSALAECLFSDVSTISRQTSALVHEGLIERRADPDDGRACLLVPTEAGHELFRAAREGRNKWLAETFRNWKPEDIAQLTELLARLNADMAEHAGPAHAPEGS